MHHPTLRPITILVALSLPFIASFLFVTVLTADNPLPTPQKASSPAVRHAATPLWVPIVMYHHVRPLTDTLDELGRSLSVSPERLREHIHALKEGGFHIITLDALHDALLGNSVLPINPIVLTFDDGYDDNFNYALPVLKKEAVHATEFVITNSVGTPGYLTWEQIKDMQSEGTFDIQSHTLNHPELSKLSRQHAWSEIKHSKDVLEERLNKPIHFFCYPYGEYTQEIIDLVQRAGYEGALTTHFGTLQSEQHAFDMPRVRLTNSDTGALLKKKLMLFIENSQKR